MEKERLEILKMLSEKVISVEEAERLLKALDEGERRREEERQYEVRHGRDPVRSAFEPLGEVLAGVGPLVKNVIEDAVSGFFGVGLGIDVSDEDDEGMERIDLSSYRFALEQGTKLVLRNDKILGGGGDLILEGIEGEHCQLLAEKAREVRAYREDARVLLFWRGGPLRVQVPQTASEVKAVCFGGAVRAKEVKAPLQVKVMGGDVELKGVLDSFRARSTGGTLNVVLAPSWRGEGQARTMGGNIFVKLPEEIHARIEAECTGGTIQASEELGRSERRQSMIQERIELQTGEGEDPSNIFLKATGGDIRLRR